MEFQRGTAFPFVWGVQRGLRSPLTGRIQRNRRFRGTRFSAGKSSMLYLCFRLPPKWGWLRHLQPGQIDSGQILLGGSRSGGFYDHGRNRDMHRGQNLLGRKSKQRYINSRPAAATLPSLVYFSLGFLTALIDIVLVLAPWAAKSGVGPTAQEHLLTMLAQAHGLVIVHQHEAERAGHCPPA